VSGIKLPFALSLAGHAACLVALALFLSTKPPPLVQPTAKGGIEVVFEPAPPKEEAAPAPPEALLPLPPEPVPPPPEPPVVAAEPPPPEPPPIEPPPPEMPPPPQPEAPVAVSEPPPPPPPPPQKHVVKKVPKPVPRHQEVPQPTQAYLPSLTPQLPAAPAPSAPPQTAMAATPMPAPVPSPEASAGYRALLSAWLESHKRYPDAARQRGEEGRAVLRFSVDRSGRVLDYAVTSSSGYPDLDQSVEEMMRGATLPPFPAGMPQPEMQISVTIRFSLRR
jgi:periplasmic protein TonB